MKIKPARRLEGTLTLPGDKSISHRAALLAAMTAPAGKEVRLENFAISADCASTLSCLEKLGVPVRREGQTVYVKGVGKRGFRAPPGPLDCGNSGTTMRLLAGVLAGQNFDSVLTGDESLRRRPMRRIIEPLARMGARVVPEENGCAPLQIRGAGDSLRAVTYRMTIASAQVKSCLLLAGLNARPGGGRTVVVNPPSEDRLPGSRNHTELMLEYLGARVEQNFTETDEGFVEEISLEADPELAARDFVIPSDISSAAFFLVAAGGLRGSEVVLKNVGLNPTRRAVVDVLRSFGARIEISGERELGNEVVADLRVSGPGVSTAAAAAAAPPAAASNRIGGGVIARLIDEIPILAVFGTQLPGGLEIRDAGELRFKESDRVSAVVENLRRMGASGVEEYPDGLRVGKSDLKGARVASFGDHRIAMAFAVAGLFAEGETEIEGAECAAVSFPDFFQTLAAISK